MYAITLRKTLCPKENTHQHYYDYLNQGLYSQKKYAPETVLKFEEKNGLHAHLMVSFLEDQPKNKNHVYQLCKPSKGWHIKVEPIYNAQGWLDYIRKEEQDPAEKVEHEHHKEWNQSVLRLTHKYGTIFNYFKQKQLDKRTKNSPLFQKHIKK